LSDARSRSGRLSPDHPATRQDEVGHGRNETRTGTVISARGLAEHHDFPCLKAFGRIESRRATDGTIQTETRHFALSLKPAPEVFKARAHRGTLNARHWQPDALCREDAARNRKDNCPGNIAILRRRAAGVACRGTSMGSLYQRPLLPGPRAASAAFPGLRHGYGAVIVHPGTVPWRPSTTA